MGIVANSACQWASIMPGISVSPAAVDHGHIVGLNDGQGLIRHRRDTIALDQDVLVFLQRFALAVEDVDVADEGQSRSRFLRCLDGTCNAKGERQ